MREIKAHEVIVHGVEHEQYFQGCGLAFTDFADVATGIGETAREAFDDALECLAQADWDVESYAWDTTIAEHKVPESAHEEIHVYVSVRVR